MSTGKASKAGKAGGASGPASAQKRQKATPGADGSRARPVKAPLIRRKTLARAAATPANATGQVRAHAPGSVLSRAPGALMQRRPARALVQALPQPDAKGAFDAGQNFEQRLRASSNGGRPLPDTSRQFMESRMGADFSAVRVHSGQPAAELNRSISAAAFTHGQHIFLGEGHTNLASGEGRRLLAHELTHTVQQGAAPLKRTALKPAEKRTGGAALQRKGKPTGSTKAKAGSKAAAPATPKAPETAVMTKPAQVKIGINPDEAVVFHSAVGELDKVAVHVTGRMAINGQVLLIGQEVPKKGASDFIRDRLAELLAGAFNAAAPTGTMSAMQFPLAGETLALELADGAENGPPFQGSGHFEAKKRSLAVEGCTVANAAITLDATLWIAPKPAPKPEKTVGPAQPAAGVPGPTAPISTSGGASGTPLPPAAGASAGPVAETSATAGDASVKSLSFAGEQAAFEGERRTGGVTLKTAMDDFESQVPDFVKKHAYLALPEQRAAFFQHMRSYFGSDENTVAHFAQMQIAKVKGARTILHKEAVERLEAVQAELGEENMPYSGGVGWPRAQCKLSGTQGLSNLHQIGFAVDYNAYQTPMIRDQRTLDLLRVVTGRSPSLNFNAPPDLDTRSTGETYTHGTDEEKAALDADPRVQKWMASVESEARAVGQASEDFRASLTVKVAKPKLKTEAGSAPVDDKAAGESADAAATTVDMAPRLQELREKWFGEKDPAQRQQILADLKPVIQPWLDKVAAEQKRMQKKIEAAGLDAQELVADSTAASRQKSMEQLFKHIKGVTGKLKTELKKGQRAGVDKAIAEARKALGEEGAAPADDAAAVAELRRLEALLESRSDTLKDAIGEAKWLSRMDTLHTALTGDPAFIFGNAAKKEVENPSLAQIMDIGFFNLRGKPKAGKEAFDVEFVKSMVKHGFNPGGTWSTPDFMHFELRWNGPGMKGK